MKRKGTGVRILMRLLGIGSNVPAASRQHAIEVVVGWRSTRDMSNLTPLTPRSY